MSKRVAQKLAHDKLASSGLTPVDAQTLGVEILTAAEVSRLSDSFNPVPALRLNYYHPLRPQEPLTPWPEWPAFYRLRYLKTYQDFTTLTAAKPPRYTQLPNSGVCAYFPRLVDWPTVAMDPREPIIITEGELKAAKASREGMATVGLGGVYNYRSAKLGITFLEELKAVNWVQRVVYIIYDSDFRSNSQVCLALNELAAELMARGALPHVVKLPDVVDDGKTGLDDFLVRRSVEELNALIRDTAELLTIGQALWDLNHQVTYVADPGLIVVDDSLQKMSPAAFRDHAFSTMMTPERTFRADGSISIKPVSAPTAWLRWPWRREACRLTYEPGRERRLPDECDGSKVELNTWPGWGVEPRKGDVSYFLKLVDHLFTDAPPEAKEWFLRWAAYPLRFPGYKLFTSVVLYGRRHGTGKSLLGYTLGKIYGDNFTEISQLDLHSSFNEWAESKQFVMGDDVTGSNKRQDADILKKLITQKHLRVNVKYVPSFVIPDRINYFFTSNHPDAFFLEDDDRRFFVHEVSVGPLDELFYADYDLWLDTGGAAFVFDYLLNLDLGRFNPTAPALLTDAKHRMIADVKSDLADWVSRLILDPDSVLRLGDVVVEGDLFSNRQLLELYRVTGPSGQVTANGLGRELRRAGVPTVNEGLPVRTPSGLTRLYAIRHPERWTHAKLESVTAHVRAHDPAGRLPL